MAEIRAGRGSQAVAALDRALAIHAACGARWDLARVRMRLRRLGVPAPPGRRAASGPGLGRADRAPSYPWSGSSPTG